MKFETAAGSDAKTIWHAGIEAVRADRLVKKALRREGNHLSLGDSSIDLTQCRQIAVVGGGKGAAHMATAVEKVLGPKLVEEKVSGWINVPADCLTDTQKVHLHAARPAGVNEPTAEGVFGSEKMLSLVRELEVTDLCLTLLTGGGSALMPAPRPPITLDELLAVTRLLMQKGVTISELNTVRTALSAIKGGGLAHACGADTLWSLIVSDVVGDPLPIIASGPTVVPENRNSRKNSADEALHILKRVGTDLIPTAVIEFLNQQTTIAENLACPPKSLVHQIIGNNAVALAAAAEKARQMNYQVITLGSDHQGEASEEGRRFVERCRQIRQTKAGTADRYCVLSGGEPVVDLGPNPGKGGRNQQFVLAAIVEMAANGSDGVTILSGGTDGEDGPTDAAGAVADATLLARSRLNNLDPDKFLQRHDAYSFFDACDGLLRTGPTQTNVMDLRVAVVEMHD